MTTISVVATLCEDGKGNLLVSREIVEWGVHTNIVFSHTLWNVGECPFLSEMEVILIIDHYAEKKSDPTICFG